MKRRTVARPLLVQCPYCGRSIPAPFRARTLTCSGCRKSSVIQGRKARKGKS